MRNYGSSKKRSTVCTQEITGLAFRARIPFRKNGCKRCRGPVTASPARIWWAAARSHGQHPPTGSPHLDVRVDHLLNVRFPDRADTLLHDLAALKEQQRWNPADVVAHGGITISIHIQLSNFHFTGILGSHSVDGRTHLAARTAPFGPEIHQNRYV